MIWNFIIATEHYKEDCNILDQAFGKGRRTSEIAEYYTEWITITVINWEGHSINQFRGRRADVLYVPFSAFNNDELYYTILQPITATIRTTESMMERLKYYLTKK